MIEVIGPLIASRAAGGGAAREGASSSASAASAAVGICDRRRRPSSPGAPGRPEARPAHAIRAALPNVPARPRRRGRRAERSCSRAAALRPLAGPNARAKLGNGGFRGGPKRAIIRRKALLQLEIQDLVDNARQRPGSYQTAQSAGSTQHARSISAACVAEGEPPTCSINFERVSTQQPLREFGHRESAVVIAEASRRNRAGSFRRWKRGRIIHAL